MVRRSARLLFGISRCCKRHSDAVRCSKESGIPLSPSNIVVSVNPLTNQRSVVQLRNSKAACLASKNLVKLPDEAIEGLKNALVTSIRTAKQLQHEADQLNSKLEQRKFPVPHHVIKKARSEVQKYLNSTNFLTVDGSSENEAVQVKEHLLKREVGKYLRRSFYNWEPLSFETRESAAVYFLARLHANYAEASKVLYELKRANFVPKRILDYGSGTCSVFWAANQLWGREVEEYQFVDPSDEMNRFAMDVMRGSDNNENRAFVHPNVNFRRFLLPSLSHKYDLVVAHRVFVELASEESRLDLLSALWARTNRFLVIIDSNSRTGFDALLSLRDYILEGGCEVHAVELKELLSSHNLLNEEIESIMSDKTLTNSERYSLLRFKVPANLELPTRLDHGFTFAPCPHDLGCPKLASELKSCEFSAKWVDLRADGKRLTNKDGTASGNYSYFIMEKGPKQLGKKFLRILKNVPGKKQVSFHTCTPFNGLQNFVISKKNEKLYKVLKARKAGELLPVEMATISSESKFDLFNEAKSVVDKS